MSLRATFSCLGLIELRLCLLQNRALTSDFRPQLLQLRRKSELFRWSSKPSNRARSLLTECHRSPERAGAAETGVPLPRYWLQRVSLSDVPNGPSTHTVKGPVLVELGPDGHVNSLPGSAEVVAGFVPVTLLTRPTDRAGLMLYAQRTTELHLDSKNGPVIGRLHPGAFVGVAASGVEHVEVALHD